MKKLADEWIEHSTVPDTLEEAFCICDRWLLSWLLIRAAERSAKEDRWWEVKNNMAACQRQSILAHSIHCCPCCPCPAPSLWVGTCTYWRLLLGNTYNSLLGRLLFVHVVSSHGSPSYEHSGPPTGIGELAPQEAPFNHQWPRLCREGLSLPLLGNCHVPIAHRHD